MTLQQRQLASLDHSTYLLPVLWDTMSVAIAHQKMDHYTCCLCKSTLPSDKRTRRKLHGESCKEVKEQLQGISVVPLANFEETSDPTAYLCRKCEQQVISFGNWTAKATALKKCIETLLSQLHCTRKRSISADAQSSTPKQPRLSLGPIRPSSSYIPPAESQKSPDVKVLLMHGTLSYHAYIYI